MSNTESDIAIRVNHVSKSFKLPHEQGNSIKSKLINFRKRGYEVQEALKDISFEVKKGDFLGIVGRNGSGKSTLLKILSGIYEPTSGSIEVNGKLTPFIELGVGFNPELSGRDNVFLNGALLGFTRKEMLAMYDEIVEFAEIERFMDQKLKNYSSGMQVRLAFSIAIRANTDILVLDEVLAVGDEAFQRKCFAYFEELKRKKKTVILVTHGMDNVRKFCNKAIMIRDGRVVASGSPEDVANEYTVENIQTMVSTGDDAEEKQTTVQNFSIEVVGNKQITQNDKIKIRLSYKTLEPTELMTIATVTDLRHNVAIFDTPSKFIKSDSNEIVTQLIELSPGEINDTNLRVSAQIRNKNKEVLAWIPSDKTPVFILKRTDYKKDSKASRYGIMLDKASWIVVDHDSSKK